jgi:hypothetical protein
VIASKNLISGLLLARSASKINTSIKTDNPEKNTQGLDS